MDPPFSGASKELKCEALASVMTECISSVTTYFAPARMTGGRCTTSHVCDSETEDVLVPADVRELCEGCFFKCQSSKVSQIW